MLVSLAEAKKYLRVDHTDDDTLITDLIATSEGMIKDTIRLENIPAKEIMETACKYAVSYFYEHRENADMRVVATNLRYMLSTERTAVF